MIDNSVKNRNQSTKILLHSFEDPSGQWEAEGDDWYRWALPVYRMPQGSWAETTGFTRQKIWFIEKVFSEDPTNPNDIDFPPWVACYWDSQAGRWVVLALSGGASGDYIIFQFVEPDESSSGSSSSSGSAEEEGLPEECEFRIPAVGPFLASVSRLGCGMESAPGADENNLIEVHDLIGIMDNRDIRDIIGREGIAIRMQNSEIESGSVSLSVNDDCIWVIVIVNFWRVVSVVTDIIFGEQEITVKRKNITVWDDCTLPDEVIEGVDCDETSSSSSGSV